MRHSVRARHRLTFVCTAWALAVPASALASGSPVHVDPSSPVAKEYALPLATARGAAPESGQPGKLFGSGIRHSPGPSARPTPPVHTPSAPETTPASATPPAARTGPTTRPETTSAPTRQPVPPSATAPAHTRQLTASAAPAAYHVLAPGSGSGWLWMVVAALAVLVIGGAGGWLLSRRR